MIFGMGTSIPGGFIAVPVREHGAHWVDVEASGG
jgi:hypothetical protein